jgi:hypothetical protein
MTDVTVTTDPPLANDPTARTSDGTLKDQSPGNTTPTPEPKPEGDSFLTGKKEPAKTEDKTTEPAKTEDKTKTESVVGAPEKYEDFKLPDGYQFDKASLTDAQTLFKDLNLTQEQAQKAVDLYAKNSLSAAEAPYKAWADLQKEWTGEIANRFPGDKSTAVKSMISGVIDTVLPPSLAKGLRTALDITGAGSHPDVVEALSILLKPLSEGTPVRGNGPSKEGQVAPGSGPPSIADALYGHLRK